MHYQNVQLSKKFKKQLKRIGKKQSQLVMEKILDFHSNPLLPMLRLHGLKGKWIGFYSIDISFDLRALFYEEDNVAIFSELGSHTQLYE